MIKRYLLTSLLVLLALTGTLVGSRVMAFDMDRAAVNEMTAEKSRAINERRENGMLLLVSFSAFIIIAIASIALLVRLKKGKLLKHKKRIRKK